MSWKYFTREEFACKHCTENAIQDALIDELDALREVLGFPLAVNSGYRCPEYNMQVSRTGRTGPHTTGLAADLRVDREHAVLLLEAALRRRFFRGFGVHQRGITGRFIHLDGVDRPTRTIWSY